MKLSVMNAFCDEPTERQKRSAREVLLLPLHEDVRDVVGMVARAFHRGGIDAARRRAALLDEDAGHDAVSTTPSCALRVERGLEDVVGGRTIEAVLKIVLRASR